MSIKSSIRWLFTPPDPCGIWRAVVWWETCRLAVNLFVGVYGVVCLLVFLAVISWSTVLKPGEDAVEPLAIVFAPVAFNVCYTFGWMVEVLQRTASPNTTAKLGPRLLLAGLVFSFAVISMPAVLSLGYLIFRVLGLLK